MFGQLAETGGLGIKGRTCIHLNVDLNVSCEA